MCLDAVVIVSFYASVTGLGAVRVDMQHRKCPYSCDALTPVCMMFHRMSCVECMVRSSY